MSLTRGLAFVFAVLSTVIGAHAALLEPRCLDSMRSAPAVLVVHGVSSGNLLAPELRARGFQPIHIYTQAGPLPMMRGSLRSDTFTREFYFDGDTDRLRADLVARGVKVRAVVAGSESGVTEAAQIARAFHREFGTPTMGNAEFLRDKHLQNLLFRKRIPVIDETLAETAEQALSWIHSKKLWPGLVVVKPRDSAGTDNVFFCENAECVERAFAASIGKLNSYNLPMRDLLVQRYMSEPEEVTNGVVSNGVIRFTDRWRYEKIPVPGGASIYRVDRSLRMASSPMRRQIIEHIRAKLELLGAMEPGVTLAFHSEDFVDHQRKIIVHGEIGGRMMGSGQPELVRKAQGEGQTQVLIEALTDPEAFLARPEVYDEGGIANYAGLVTFNNFLPGKVVNLTAESRAEVEKIPGYFRSAFQLRDGDPAEVAIDMNKSIGQVEFVLPTEAEREEAILAALAVESRLVRDPTAKDRPRRVGTHIDPKLDLELRKAPDSYFRVEIAIQAVESAQLMTALSQGKIRARPLYKSQRERLTSLPWVLRFAVVEKDREFGNRRTYRLLVGGTGREVQKWLETLPTRPGSARAELLSHY